MMSLWNSELSSNFEHARRIFKKEKPIKAFNVPTTVSILEEINWPSISCFLFSHHSKKENSGWAGQLHQIVKTQHCILCHSNMPTTLFWTVERCWHSTYLEAYHLIKAPRFHRRKILRSAPNIFTRMNYGTKCARQRIRSYSVSYCTCMHHTHSLKHLQVHGCPHILPVVVDIIAMSWICFAVLFPSPPGAQGLYFIIENRLRLLTWRQWGRKFYPTRYLLSVRPSLGLQTRES